MPELMQDVIVTLVAIAAAYVVVRRVFLMVGPGNGSPKCDSCPANDGIAEQVNDASTAKQLTLVREQRR